MTSSTSTMQLEPDTLEARRTWFDAHGDAHPILVAELCGELIAWASLSRFNPRRGYDRTAEVSIYVRDDHRGRGVGRLLLSTLISRAREHRRHVLVSSVSADQGGSIALHLALGFREVGRLREVGFKHGRWVDVVYFQLLLDEPWVEAPPSSQRSPANA